MGFITWTLHRNHQGQGIVHFEPDTGRPYTYEIIYKKVYLEENKTTENSNVLDLPPRFCQFARLDGNYLYPYFKGINGNNDPLMTFIDNLVEYYPTWESVKNSKEWIDNDGDKSGWDETKHNLFKECLEWCKEQGGFWGKWPY